MHSVVNTFGGRGGGTFGLMIVLDLLKNEKRKLEILLDKIHNIDYFTLFITNKS